MPSLSTMTYRPTLPLENVTCLLHPTLVFVEVKLSPDGRPYTYKALREDGIAVGDLVLVPTDYRREGATNLNVGTVTKVQASDDVSLNVPYAYKWVVQKIDTNQFDRRSQLDAFQVHKIREGIEADQRRAERLSLLKILPGNIDRILEDSAAFAGQPLSDFSIQKIQELAGAPIPVPNFDEAAPVPVPNFNAEDDGPAF